MKLLELPEEEIVYRKAHKDSRGATIKYRCGCTLVVRGQRLKRGFCDGHGAILPATPEPQEGE